MNQPYDGQIRAGDAAVEAALVSARADAADTPPLVYLAAPYSHPNLRVRAARYRACNRAAGRLWLERRQLPFSPITHSHPVCVFARSAGTWAEWSALDRVVLPACRRLYVLTLPGYLASVGVQAELELAHDAGVPVEELDPAYWSAPIDVPTMHWGAL